MAVSGLNAKANCAGQACAERDGCRRYRIRIADGYEYHGDLKLPRIVWASLDLERLLFGSCSAFVQWRPH